VHKIYGKPASIGCLVTEHYTNMLTTYGTVCTFKTTALSNMLSRMFCATHLPQMMNRLND